jgi:RNA polymerase sigma-70 factor (ECF subfamily)
VEVPERDLVAAAKAGDRSAFKVLAERYYRRIFRMLVAMTHDEEAAMDLTQDTFARALGAIGGFQMTSAFYTWLYRIAMNAAYDRSRRNRSSGVVAEYDDRLDHEESVGDGVGPSLPQDALDVVSNRQALEKVRAALAELRPEHREIIVLREVEECSYEEIAEILGIKIGTVMSRLFAARMKLREILAQRHGMKGYA